MKNSTIAELQKKVAILNKVYDRDNKWTFKIDGLTGEIRLRASLCSTLLGLNSNGLRQIIEETHKPELRERIVKAFKHSTKINEWLTEGISLSDFQVLLDVCSYRKQGRRIYNVYQQCGENQFFVSLLQQLIPKEVFDLLSKKHLVEYAISKPKRPKITRIKRYRPAYDAIDKTQKELAIVRHLQKLWGGEREAPTLSGNIDLLTADKLIEVKSGENWKHGIGQLISYGYHKPDYQQVLYLFDYENLDLANVRAVCGKVGIKVMLHE